MRNALLFSVVLAFTAPVLAGRTEQILQQSDDTMEDYCDTYGVYIAQWFEVPVDCHVLSSSFYFRYGGPGEFSVWVGVWANDDSGPYDVPGELLWFLPHDFPGETSWTWSDYVDLTGTDYGLTMSSGEKFWVGLNEWVHNGYVGLDKSSPSYGYAISTNGINWIFIYDTDMMVRVKIDDDVDPPYVDGQDPAPDRTGGADPGTDIVFHCKDDDKGVDSGTIHFTVNDGTKADVSGTLDIDDADLNDVICTFTPDGDLPEGATITCTVRRTLADGLGNEMWIDEVWSFTVGYVNVDEASLGEIKATYR